MRLADRVAIVTGAGQGGIGEACAMRLAQEGASVIVADVREEAAAATVAEVQALGRRAFAVRADVTDRQQVQRMVEASVGTFGKVDILANVAGGSRHLVARSGEALLPHQISAESTTEEYWDYIIDFNLKSTFLCCQAVIGHMKAQGYGRIVNVSSTKGRTSHHPLTGPAYAAAKGGVISLTRYLATELGPHGITVNAIAPGGVKTLLSKASRGDRPTDTISPRPEIPLGRTSEPSEQAAAIAFLASDDASYVTGAVIDVNGGWFMG